MLKLNGVENWWEEIIFSSINFNSKDPQTIHLISKNITELV